MKQFILATAFALSAGTVSAASLLVDDFSTFQDATVGGAPGDMAVSYDPAPAGAIGDRRLSVTKVTGAFGLSASTKSVPDVGLSLSSDGGVHALHSVKYGALVPLGLDVSMFNVISFSVDFLDLAGVTFGATLTDAMGSETDLISLDSTAPPGYVRTFNLANFTMVDLSDIQMIEFTFDGLQGADLIVRDISFEVPVPAALPLLLTGLGGVGLLRLRRKS